MIASKPLEVTFICKDKHLKIDVAEIGLDELLAKLKAALPDIDMGERELTYIDDEGDCISIDDISDWQVYIEYAADSQDAISRSILMFDKLVNEKLRAIINRSIQNMAKCESVNLDDSIAEEIIDEVKSNSACFSIKEHDTLSGNDSQSQKATEHKIQDEVESLVQEKITNGDIQLSEVSHDIQTSSTMNSSDKSNSIGYRLTRVIKNAKRKDEIRKLQRKGMNGIQREVKKLARETGKVLNAIKKSFKL